MTIIKQLGFLIYASLCIGITLSLTLVFFLAEPLVAIPLGSIAAFFYFITKHTSIGA